MPKLVTVFLFTLLLNTSAFAAAYQMIGTSTQIWDFDVDYYAMPITLVRTSNTAIIHRIDFYVNSYQQYCRYWQSRCTRYDAYGRCIQWENVCAQWDTQVSKVPKTIYLDFKNAHPIPAGVQEGYQLSIQRTRPNFNGEDWVYTSLYISTPYLPEQVVRYNDYRYMIRAH